MAETPKRTWRRFFQFKISTWLVLVGILAWAMACRPYSHIHRYQLFANQGESVAPGWLYGTGGGRFRRKPTAVEPWAWWGGAGRMVASE